jgi:hypothetical protein
MTGETDLPLSKLKRIIQIVVVGQVVLFIGLVADVTTILTSGWFKTVLSADVIWWSSYILNLVLTCLVIYIFRRASKQEGSFRAMVKGEQGRLERLKAYDVSLWKRFTRTFRSIALKDLPTPSTRDALEPLLDELAKRLPDNGAHYKLAIARPNPDGTFKILAERGMDPATVFTIEQMANWKEKRSFFANVLDLDRDDETQYALYYTGETNYLDIQKAAGTGNRPSSSGSHFIVAIKQSTYYHNLPKHVLALVSVGIPKGREIKEDEQEVFYQNLYPIIKGIEAILLGYLLTEGLAMPRSADERTVKGDSVHQ